MVQSADKRSDPTKSLEELIDRFRSQDLATASDEDISAQIQKIMDGYACYTRTVSMSACYRARINESHVFQHVSELWYPPASAVTNPGRVNRTGNSVFYVASSQDTAILELRPEVGTRMTVLCCTLRDSRLRPHVMDVGVSEFVGPHDPKVAGRLVEDTVDGVRKLETKEGLARNRRIRKFLCAELMRIVPPEDCTAYRVTQAIADIMLQSKRIDGLWYPSIALNHKGSNIALKPSSADRLLRPYLAWEALVEERVGDLEP